jgi:flagellar export protein FliJ
MKRFKFRLEAVHGLRAFREKEKLEALAATVQQLATAKEAVASAAARQHDLGDALMDGRKQGSAAGSHAVGLAAWQLTLVELERVVKAREAAQAEYQTAYENWLSASGDLRAIDRLKTRDQQMHREHSDRVEQAQLDEFAGFAASRKGGAW